jgi:hypothetical protein
MLTWASFLARYGEDETGGFLAEEDRRHDAKSLFRGVRVRRGRIRTSMCRPASDTGYREAGPVESGAKVI